MTKFSCKLRWFDYGLFMSFYNVQQLFYDIQFYNPMSHDLNNCNCY
jgi:hypothetical protein